MHFLLPILIRSLEEELKRRCGVPGSSPDPIIVIAAHQQQATGGRRRWEAGEGGIIIIAATMIMCNEPLASLFITVPLCATTTRQLTATIRSSVKERVEHRYRSHRARCSSLAAPTLQMLLHNALEQLCTTLCSFGFAPPQRCDIVRHTTKTQLLKLFYHSFSCPVTPCFL